MKTTRDWSDAQLQEAARSKTEKQVVAQTVLKGWNDWSMDRERESEQEKAERVQKLRRQQTEAEIMRLLNQIERLADDGHATQKSIQGESQQSVESLTDLVKNPNAIFGIGADIWGGVTPPPLSAWSLPKSLVKSARAALASGNLEEALRGLKRAQEEAASAHANYQAYSKKTMKGAEDLITDLEKVRDNAIAVELALGAAVAAPLVGGAVAGGGLTGAAGTVVTAGATGAIIGAEGALMRGGTAAADSYRNRGQVHLDDVLEGAEKGYLEGYVTGLAGGAIPGVKSAMGVGKAGISVGQNMLRQAAAEGLVGGGGGFLTTVAQGGSLKEGGKAGAKGLLSGGVTGLAGGATGKARPLIEKFIGATTSAATTGAEKLIEGKSARDVGLAALGAAAQDILISSAERSGGVYFARSAGSKTNKSRGTTTEQAAGQQTRSSASAKAAPRASTVSSKTDPPAGGIGSADLGNWIEHLKIQSGKYMAPSETPYHVGALRIGGTSVDSGPSPSIDGPKGAFTVHGVTFPAPEGGINSARIRLEQRAEPMEISRYWTQDYKNEAGPWWTRSSNFAAGFTPTAIDYNRQVSAVPLGWNDMNARTDAWLPSSKTTIVGPGLSVRHYAGGAEQYFIPDMNAEMLQNWGHVRSKAPLILTQGPNPPKQPALLTPGSNPPSQPLSLPGPQTTRLLPPGPPPATALSKTFGKGAEPRILLEVSPNARQLSREHQAFDGIQGGKSTIVESTGTIKGRRVKSLEEVIEGGNGISIKTVPERSKATPDHCRRVVEDALRDIFNYIHNGPTKKHPIDTPPAGNVPWRSIVKEPDQVTIVIEIGVSVTPQLRAAAEDAVRNWPSIRDIPPVTVIVKSTE